MYSDVLRPKIDVLFDEISKSVNESIDISASREAAAQSVTDIVSSTLAARSKTMLSDLYSTLSKEVLNNCPDISKQNDFYEADLRGELFSKYNFATTVSKMDYKEVNQLLVAGCVTGGIALVGGIGVYAALKNALISSWVIPVAALVAVSIGAFLATYISTGKINKANFKKATNNYLTGMKKDFLAWFDTIEEYFNKRVQEIME